MISKSLLERGTAGMIVGYARTSTLEQEAGLKAQERDLKAAGAERVFSEQVSSMAKRNALEEALSYVREGDVFVCTKTDRLARSITNLWDLVKRLNDAGVALRILDLNLDTSTPTGKLMLSVMGGIAEFERSMMLERQREGIAKAKSEGKYRGRKPTARAKSHLVVSLSNQGKSMGEIALITGIGKGSVHRILKSGADTVSA